MSKLPSTCPEEQFVPWIFFKFWFVPDFLQKPLACFSKFYLGVQIKNCGKNSFFCFLFRLFSIFERKFFRLLAKPSKSCENYLLRVHRNSLWLQNFLKSFEPFWIFYRNLWHGSQISIYMSRVKIAEEIVFLFFFSEFFSDFERNFSLTFGEKSSKSCHNYLLRVQRNNLWLEIFFKSFESFPIFCRNRWHGSQNSIYVSRVKIAEKIVFFVFLLRFFFGIWAKNFSDFPPKNFKKLSKLPSACAEEQFVVWKIFKSFESFWIFCKNLWHGSQISIFVSRVKIAEEIVFFFFSEFFSDFERNFSLTFGEKSSKSCHN